MCFPGRTRRGGAFALLILLTAAGSAAQSVPEKSTLLRAAAEIMREARYCALTTLDRDGAPQVRAMEPFPPEDDRLTVWLATNAKTRKVEQIRRDPRVSLFYLDPKGPGYVALAGRAELVTDPAEKRRRWKEAWAPFYDERNRGDDYVLIRVKPSRLEIVSAPHGIAAEPKAWRPAIVDLP